MWEGDLSGLQTAFVDNVFFCGKREPDWFEIQGVVPVRGVGGGLQKVFGGRGGCFAIGFGTDVFEEGAGGFECLENVRTNSCVGTRRT